MNYHDSIVKIKISRFYIKSYSEVVASGWKLRWENEEENFGEKDLSNDGCFQLNLISEVLNYQESEASMRVIDFSDR